MLINAFFVKIKIYNFAFFWKSFALAGLQFQTGGAENLPHPDNSAQVLQLATCPLIFKKSSARRLQTTNAKKISL